MHAAVRRCFSLEIRGLRRPAEICSGRATPRLGSPAKIAGPESRPAARQRSRFFDTFFSALWHELYDRRQNANAHREHSPQANGQAKRKGIEPGIHVFELRIELGLHVFELRIYMRGEGLKV